MPNAYWPSGAPANVVGFSKSPNIYSTSIAREPRYSRPTANKDQLDFSHFSEEQKQAVQARGKASVAKAKAFQHKVTKPSKKSSSLEQVLKRFRK